MSFEDAYPIIAEHAVLRSRRRPGRSISPAVRFIVAHDTGNPGASARAHARWYRSDPNPPLDRVSSAHLFVDDKVIIETIPAFAAPEQALHVLYNRPKDNELYGVDANCAAIGVEYCYGGDIDADQAYARFVWVIAKLCDHYHLDPSRDVVGHQVLDPGRKSDPGMGLRASGRSYEKLLRDVVDRFRHAGGDAQAIGSHRIAAGSAVTTVNLRRRKQAKLDADTIDVLPPGSTVTIVKVVSGPVVSGNDDWCELADGGFCWSGGLK